MSSTGWPGPRRSAPTPSCKGTARWIIRSLAAAAGIRPASIHDLYMAMGRGEVGGFTVPAINVRAMAYDTARAVIRAAKKLERRRVHLRDRALRDRLHGAASARVRGGRVRRGAARGFHRPALHPGRSRPDQRQEVQQPRARQGAGDAARAHQAKRSPPVSTTSTSTRRRSSISTSRRWPNSRR